MNSVLICGASRGIGRSSAEYFAKKGFRDIGISARTDVSGLAECARSVASYGAECHTYLGNIAEEGFVQEMLNDFEKRCSGLLIPGYIGTASMRPDTQAGLGPYYGGPDVLVVCAGVDHYGLLQDMTYEEWNELFAVNVGGAFLAAKYAIPVMLQRGGGSIVFLSSVWGSRAASCETAYAATKGAVEAMTRSLAAELGPSHIRVNAIAPGYIDTKMNSRFTPEEVRAVVDEIPLGRTGTPEDVAKAIYSVAVEQTYMTGQIISVDGGFRI